MNIPIKTKNEVSTPPSGFVFPFIDAATNKFMVKLSNGEFITFNSGSELPEDFKPLDFTDYTAYEVYPHSNVIPVGTHDVLGEISEELAGNQMAQSIVIRSEQPLAESNIVIDWGDGNITAFNDETISDLITVSGETYTITHTYSTECDGQKQVIKIYGNTYYGVMTVAANNIVCRVLDADLPVASHITNFSSYAAYSTHITKVNVFNSLFNLNATNCSNMFVGNINLQEAIGFSAYNKLGACTSIFYNCYNLKTSTFRLPAKPVGKIINTYTNCSSLVADINNLLPVEGFVNGSELNFGQTFINCANISGTVPAKMLWENTTIRWIGIPDNTGKGAFNGCTLIENQIPVGWGGTNTSIVVKPYIQTQIDKIDGQIESIENELEDYTSFELDTISQQTFGTVITLTKAAAECDVVIDFGDSFGKVSLKDAKATVQEGNTNPNKRTWLVPEAGENIYWLGHFFINKGKHTVKIYGKDYINLNGTKFIQNGNNCISRIFTPDLPIASHLVDFTGMCAGSKVLTSVDIRTATFNIQPHIIDRTFENCINLSSAFGFNKSNPFIKSAVDTFKNCTSLVETDKDEVFATEEYVKTAINNIEIPVPKEVDLTGYATINYVDEQVSGQVNEAIRLFNEAINDTNNQVNGQVNQVSGQVNELSSKFVTVKDEQTEQINGINKNIVNISGVINNLFDTLDVDVLSANVAAISGTLSGLDTKIEEVDTLLGKLSGDTAANLANDIKEVSGKVETNTNNIKELNNKFADYATINYVDTQITAQVSGKADKSELNVLATKTYVDETVIAQVSSKADKSELSSYATNDYVNTQISDKATKNYVDTQISDKATKNYVDTQITAQVSGKADKTDLNGLATEEYVNGQVSGKADKSELANYAAVTVVNELSGKVDNKADKTDLNGLATEEYVKTAINGIEIPVPDDVDLTGYAKETYVKTYVDDKVSGKADKSELNSLATETYVNTQIITQVSGKADKSELNGLATEQFVRTEIAKIELPENVDLSNYVTSGEFNQHILQFKELSGNFDIAVEQVSDLSGKFVAANNTQANNNLILNNKVTELSGKFDNITNNIDTDVTELSIWTTATEIGANSIIDINTYEIDSSATDSDANIISSNFVKLYQAIPVSNTHCITIQTPKKPVTELDVIIDWGDNNKVNLNSVTNGLVDNVQIYEYSTCNYITFEHVYPVGNAIYNLKITGKDYFGAQNSRWSDDGFIFNPSKNLVAGVKNIAKCVTNWSDMFHSSNRLLTFNLSRYSLQLRNCLNLFATFKDCYNLKYAYGFYPQTMTITSCADLFNNCRNLLDTDFRLPSWQELPDMNHTFNWCQKLNKNILDLLPNAGFAMKNINIKSCFTAAKMLHLGEEADILENSKKLATIFWEDLTKNWINYDFTEGNVIKGAFYLTSANQSISGTGKVKVVDYVPKSWGGNNTEISVTSLATMDDISKINTTLGELSTKLDEAAAIVG